jgi:diguanylate cyclase (GGDEF)-like protein
MERNELEKIIDEEYKNVRERWRHKHLQLMLVMSAVVIGLEFVMIFVITGNHMASSPTQRYLEKYFAAPVICYAVISLATVLLLHMEKLSAAAKNYAVSIGFAMICAVMCFMHDYFFAVYASGVIAIVLTVVYCDIRLTAVTSGFMILAETAIGVFGQWDPTVVRDSQYRIDVVIIIIILAVAFFGSLSIIKWENMRNGEVVTKQSEVEQLRDRILVDDLTGIYNRAGVRRFFDDAEPPVALVMMDIDHFKYVNDTWGHQTGDDILSGFGNILLAHADNARFDFRYGGDEFLLAFIDTTVDEASAKCEKLRVMFEESLPPEVRLAGISLSYGVAEYLKGMTPGEGIAHADHALYADKKRAETSQDM